MILSGKFLLSKISSTAKSFISDLAHLCIKTKLHDLADCF